MESSSNKIKVEMYMVGQLLTSLQLTKGEKVFVDTLRQTLIPNFLKESRKYSYLLEQLNWQSIVIRAFNREHQEVLPLKTKKTGNSYFEVTEQAIIQFDVACDFLEIGKKEEEKEAIITGLSTVNSERYDYFGEFVQMQKQIEEMGQKIRQSEKEIEQSKKRMEQSDKEMEMAKKKIEQSEKELEIAKNRIEQSDKEIEMAKKRMEQSDKEFELAKKRIEQLGKLKLSKIYFLIYF